MACELCGAPDKTDLSAEGHGLILKSQAARMSGRSSTWVNDRITCKDLEARTYAGRQYVVLESLERLLRVDPPPTAADLEIERLGKAGQVDRAKALFRRTYPNAHPGHPMMHDYADSMPHEEPTRPANPTDLFLRNFGKGS